MNWKILNGVLFAGNKRVILAHVTGYSIETPTVIIEMANGCRLSLSAGADGPAMVEAMDKHFTE